MVDLKRSVVPPRMTNGLAVNWGARRMVHSVVLTLGGLLLGASLLAHSEPKSADSGTQTILRKAQGVVRQLSQDKAALEAEKAAWLKEKVDLETRLQALSDNAQKVQSLQAELERARQSAQDAQHEVEALASRSQDREARLKEKNRTIVTQAQAIQADNELLVQAVKEREHWIAQCTDRNGKLLEANRRVLEAYEEKGFWDKVADLEPFTGIGKVKTETASEQFRYTLDHLRVTPFEDSKATDERGGAALPAAENPVPDSESDAAVEAEP